MLGSTYFKEEMVSCAKQLRELGLNGWIHPDYEAFVRGEKQDIVKRWHKGERAALKKENNYLKVHYKHILESDAILIVNAEKNGVKNYIGGNVLIEMGQAYVNDKKIFFLYDMPTNSGYLDEIESMDPICLNGNLEYQGTYQKMSAEEQIDVLDEKGNKTGKVVSKTEVHKSGLWHRTVHVWFLNSKNQLLLQRRAKQKINHPGMWDISVAGHISAGQTSKEAAEREIQEEIGTHLDPTELEHLFTVASHSTINNGTYIDQEFQDVYLVRKDLDLSKLVFSDREVEEVMYIDISELKRWVDEKKENLVKHTEEYNRLIELLTPKP